MVLLITQACILVTYEDATVPYTSPIPHFNYVLSNKTYLTLAKIIEK